jgi:hypothetical protein
VANGGVIPVGRWLSPLGADGGDGGEPLKLSGANFTNKAGNAIVSRTAIFS